MSKPSDNRHLFSVMLDEDDARSVREAIELRQSLLYPDGSICLPDGTSCVTGTTLAEICRGWMEAIHAHRAQQIDVVNALMVEMGLGQR